MKFWLTAAAGVVLVTGLGTLLILTNPDAFDSKTPNPALRVAPKPSKEENLPRAEFDEDKRIDERKGVPQFTEGISRYRVWNDGDGELIVQLGDKSCGCAAIRIDKDGKTLSRFAKTKKAEDIERKLKEEDRDKAADAVEGQGNIDPGAQIKLAKGESAELVIEWDSKDSIGTKQIVGSVLTNDPRDSRRVIEFVVRLDIMPEIIFDPPMISFGEIQDNQRREESLAVYSLSRDDLDVQFESASTESLRAEVRPMTPEELSGRSAKSGFWVTVVAEGKFPAGDFLGKILFKTNVETKKEQEVGVTGNVRGEIMVQPAEADFGIVSQNGGIKRSVTVSTPLFGPGDRLEVDEKTIEPEFVEANLRKPDDSGRVWILDIAIKPNQHVGAFTGWVNLKDAKGDVRVNVRVRGSVAGTASSK